MIGDTDGNFHKRLLDELHDGVYFVDTDRRITYWNSGAERLTGYERTEVVGKCCRDNILMHVDEQGSKLCSAERCPAAQTIRDGKSRDASVYLRHKSGHRVPVVTRVSAIRDESGRTIGAVEVFSDRTAEAAAKEQIGELRKLVLLDPLTGLGNRRRADSMIQSRLAELGRYGWAFGVLFADIDYFKKVNDTYGHDVGDKVLKMVARSLVASKRAMDAVCRWGGEEFVVIAAAVDREKLGIAAERSRILVEQSSLAMGSGQLCVTVAIGATIAQRGDAPESLLQRADRLMYKSKIAGRNRVTLG